MEKNELMHKYGKLYNFMAESQDPKNMMLFGEVMTEMMERMTKTDPSFAEQEIEKLEAMKWQQYLTKAEADDIVAKMQPPAPWNFSIWSQALESANLETERDEVFNRYALWVVMNGIMSDHSNTLDLFLSGDKTALLKLVYQLAVEKLTDADGKYNVRKYYL